MTTVKIHGKVIVENSIVLNPNSAKKKKMDKFKNKLKIFVIETKF